MSEVMSIIDSTDIEPSHLIFEPKPVLFEPQAKTQALSTAIFKEYKSSEELTQEMKEKGLLVINSIDPKETLPGGYRSSAAVPYYPDSRINKLGLDTLKLSGSSQFSEQSLKSIVAKTNLVAEHSFNQNKLDNDKKKPKLAILNLRQEDEIFLNGYCVSRVMPITWWTGENPEGNRSIQAIEKAEESFKSLMGRDVVVYNVEDGSAPKDQHTVLYEMTIPSVEKIQTEKELAESLGLVYHRIPDKKFGPVAWEDTDDFVEFTKNLPDDMWLHIHCKRGQSRTTLFMIMYDIMKNAEKVSLDDIIYRQGPLGLGGSELSKLPQDWSYEYKGQWIKFLKEFYNYVLQQKPQNFEKKWSIWAQEHGLPFPVPLQVQGKYYEDTTVNSMLPEELSKRKMPLVVNILNEGKISSQNFRSSKMLFHYDFPGKDLLQQEEVKLSGSTQPTSTNLEILIPQLKKWAKDVVIVDLRHDVHVLADGSDINDFETVNQLAEKISSEEIIQLEEKLAKWIMDQDGIEAQLVESRYPKDDYETFATFGIKPTKVETEKQVAEALGAQYFRIAGRRFADINDEDVDQLLTLMKSMDPKTWYHFHCKKGKSRTTHFMILYLIIKNALVNQEKPLKIEEIYDLAYLMGGVDLRNIAPKDPSWKAEYQSKIQWIQFTIRFYTYCQEEAKNGFSKPWKEWSNEHIDFQPDVEYLYRLNLSK